MTLSGFGKDEILRTLAWRPIAVAAMASSSKVICGGLIMQKIHGLSLFEGDDDNCLFTVLGLPTPASWQGDHTQIVVAAMAGVWHASTREVILGTENGKLHEIAVDEKDKRDKYIKFLFELSEYPEAFEGLQLKYVLCLKFVYRLYRWKQLAWQCNTDTPQLPAYDILEASSVPGQQIFFKMSLDSPDDSK
ncbi:hypothetical protein Tco_0567533 [Tanacetum coccineum]